MAISIPGDVRQLLNAPDYVHLSTLRADDSPRDWVVWMGLADDCILVCTSDAIWKAKDMRRDPGVALPVTDMTDPYRVAAIQGQVVDVGPDEGCHYMASRLRGYAGARLTGSALGVHPPGSASHRAVICEEPP